MPWPGTIGSLEDGHKIRLKFDAVLLDVDFAESTVPHLLEGSQDVVKPLLFVFILFVDVDLVYPISVVRLLVFF